MAYNITQYARHLYLNSIFMPKDDVDLYIKHEGPMKAQTYDQYEEQQLLPTREDLTFNLDIFDFNAERALLRKRTKEEGSSVTRFPIPPLPEDTFAAFQDGIPIATRPHECILKTDHIPNKIWYSKEFQSAPIKESGHREYMDIIEVSFIANKLSSGKNEILRQYREMFQKSLHSDDTVLRVIDEVEWKAKEEFWSIEECDLLDRAFADGFRVADLVFEFFQQQWPLYPKRPENLRQAWMCRYGHVYM